MSDESRSWSAGELADAIRNGEIESNIDAVMSDDSDFADLLLYLESTIEDVDDSEVYKQIARKSQTDTLRNARRNGDIATMSAATGITGKEKTDASAFELLDIIERLFRPDDRDHMLNMVLYAPPPPEGPTGVGKTDFAYTVIEGAQRIHDSLAVASNNNSDEFEDVESWTGLESWLESTSGTKVFLFDEAAQILQYADMTTGRALSNLIKLLRKHDCHLLVIGHTGRDIPKDIRRMVLFCRKDSKKEATIGAGLEEGDAGWMNIKNELHHLTSIPATKIEYSSTGDEGTFVFDKDESGDGDGGSGDSGGSNPRLKCRGHKAHGSGCNSMTTHRSGYCEWHREQWDGDDDPRLEDDE